MRLLLTAVATALLVTACGNSGSPQSAPTTVDPGPPPVAVPSVSLGGTPTSTVIKVPRSSPAKPVTQAQRAAFLDKLSAIDEPALKSADPDALVSEGQEICTSIANNEAPEGLIITTTATFDVSIGNAQKIIDAARATLCT